MPFDADEFLDQLPNLLKTLSDPVTPHTEEELICRMYTTWSLCVPILMNELAKNDSDVKRLILGIIAEVRNGWESLSVEPFAKTVVSLLKDDDRLVRMSAILTVQAMGLDDKDAISGLKHIISNDELLLATQAMISLLELDMFSYTLDGGRPLVEKISRLFRDS